MGIAQMGQEESACVLFRRGLPAYAPVPGKSTQEGPQVRSAPDAGWDGCKSRRFESPCRAVIIRILEIRRMNGGRHENRNVRCRTNRNTVLMESCPERRVSKRPDSVDKRAIYKESPGGQSRQPARVSALFHTIHIVLQLRSQHQRRRKAL